MIAVSWVNVTGGRRVAVNVPEGQYITLEWEQARQVAAALASFIRQQGRNSA